MDDSKVIKVGSDGSLTAPVPGTSISEWLAAIVDSSEDAIIGKTLDSVIRSWNAAATRIFAYQPDEIIGQSVLTLIPPELRHEETMIVDNLRHGKRVDHFETVRLRRDGRRIDVSLSVSPIRDRGGHIVGAAKIARDITEQKRLRRAEREASDQLEQTAAELEQQVEEALALQDQLELANTELTRALSDADAARRVAEEANATKSRFLATMSHELRTPLNAIAGYVDLLDLGVHGPVTNEQREDFSRIKRSQQTLLHLIDDVLTFAKLEAGRAEYHFEEIRFAEFLESLESFIAPRLRQKKLTYELDSCDPEMTVRMDREKVERVLLNLLSNAVKFTDKGGVRVECKAEHDFLRVDVHDTGRGIPADKLDQVFDPFVQANSSLTQRIEGTGLGLSISRQLSRAMGGDVTVKSTVGKGSTFTLILPRTRSVGA